MIDLRKTIIPKSDQLNADDLIGLDKTIKVSKVLLTTEADQPVALGYEGDNGKPYKPCKSMRRVLVMVWGPDGNAYVGRRLTLYRDDKVLFGGAAVGGIRISHMSGIDQPVTMALTVTRANKKPFTVKPLAPERTDEAEVGAGGQPYADELERAADQFTDADELQQWFTREVDSAAWKELKEANRSRAAKVRDVVLAKIAKLRNAAIPS
jgi:hypothetical protein